MQHAIRLLVILEACGELVKAGDPVGAVKVIRSELRLQALDFWLRNPDYLADELVTKVESGELPDSCLDTARYLLDDPEPDLRWYPMPRWHYGAYEAIDDAFAILDAYGLALVRRKGGVVKAARSEFFLTGKGQAAVADLTAEPRLSWYTRQVGLVALVSGDDLGSELKKRQYRQAEYAKTELGVAIAPIAGSVRVRLEGLRGTLDQPAEDLGAVEAAI
ncbi:hypothetical protein B0I31_10930 [Saccharothrix carnea]|uniref:Uncharacterized protein n=1 Tax=Saccharothrix carnea TaxID=1280637 RepID=A0A2P8I451_SACCR|nr:hypothetical protein [Saccharothrix carnea]PSL53240.1 hypothetical protein B0I31_10930 [Saccharothrix carnea]